MFKKKYLCTDSNYAVKSLSIMISIEFLILLEMYTKPKTKNQKPLGRTTISQFKWFCSMLAFECSALSARLKFQTAIDQQENFKRTGK